MGGILIGKVALAALLLTGVCAVAQESDRALPALDLPEALRSAVPLPVSEADLPTVEAVEYFKVSDQALQLECPVFEPGGDLLFCEVFGGRVYRLTPDKKLSTVLGENELRPAGLEVHKNGRIYMAELGDFAAQGSVVSMDADGTNIEEIVPRSSGFLADDLVFDKQGGFYFTDFKGGSSRPDGGVYYVGPDGGEPVSILPNLRIANGIGLSADGKTLWVTELAGGKLHRVSLSDATTVAPFGDLITYTFTGAGPDSLRIDADGNVYVAMYGQARVLVFNPLGLPIGQYLLPGRDEGHNLRSTSMAIRPGTDEMLILTNDWDRGRGSTIFAVRALAKAAPSFAIDE
ncbi:SMP-30/gluconolactonase/LRE family protein [Aurantimonas endophytica]|uniref:Lactonase n=1 Tax=Aurantimonas endophytica TaxID=1522175 RepID=A0A7W6HDZ3_9HYPH|nr:SMP-30/gluconolactonase/LRE family protein [Aurantimonas endophytica]MBB4003413.1 lactonase [Aurantimonas endophytica]MCO6404274.1 SMP-30/gluconolactonase/LRE family protein [Aurantimonas endophytica]